MYDTALSHEINSDALLSTSVNIRTIYSQVQFFLYLTVIFSLLGKVMCLCAKTGLQKDLPVSGILCKQL